MQSPELLQRMAALEQQLRRSRRFHRALLLVALLAAAAILMGQHAAKTVAAERFVLQDAQGSPRGIWEVHDDQVSLRLIDSEGANRLHLSVNPEGVPSLAVLGPNGRTVRGVFGMGENGAAAVFLQGSDGSKRIGMTVTEAGVPAVTINDAQEQPRVALGVASNGVTFIALKDEAGATKSFLYIGQDGAGGLTIKDAAGKVVSRLP